MGPDWARGHDDSVGWGKAKHPHHGVHRIDDRRVARAACPPDAFRPAFEAEARPVRNDTLGGDDNDVTGTFIGFL
jgi:hypothetical protein